MSGNSDTQKTSSKRKAVRAKPKRKSVYWEERIDPPNLAVHEFKRILPLIPLSIVPILEPRKSTLGTYGRTGEKQIFKFDFQMVLLGKRHEYFIKGYFFEEGSLRGVEIQSFRRKSNPSLR